MGSAKLCTCITVNIEPEEIKKFNVAESTELREASAVKNGFKSKSVSYWKSFTAATGWSRIKANNGPFSYLRQLYATRSALLEWQSLLLIASGRGNSCNIRSQWEPSWHRLTTQSLPFAYLDLLLRCWRNSIAEVPHLFRCVNYVSCSKQSVASHFSKVGSINVISLILSEKL